MSEGVDEVARTKIDGHIDICSERYGNLWAGVQRVENQVHALNGRVFSIVLGALGAAFGAIFGLLYVILNLKVHP